MQKMHVNITKQGNVYLIYIEIDNYLWNRTSVTTSCCLVYKQEHRMLVIAQALRSFARRKKQGGIQCTNWWCTCLRRVNTSIRGYRRNLVLFWRMYLGTFFGILYQGYIVFSWVNYTTTVCLNRHWLVDIYNTGSKCCSLRLNLNRFIYKSYMHVCIYIYCREVHSSRWRNDGKFIADGSGTRIMSRPKLWYGKSNILFYTNCIHVRFLNI